MASSTTIWFSLCADYDLTLASLIATNCCLSSRAFISHLFSRLYLYLWWFLAMFLFNIFCSISFSCIFKAKFKKDFHERHRKKLLFLDLFHNWDTSTFNALSIPAWILPRKCNEMKLLKSQSSSDPQIPKKISFNDHCSMSHSIVLAIRKWWPH